ncbi:GlsB/YeaQ/YmgE family stress response membrane protein [Salipiger sp.]|uniref:GlsB/YeaQ/YmgE family stress response membrane protein n=1 Tax=Salipiger sp. TaxID=2078585 RepID=UPI003A9767DB
MKTFWCTGALTLAFAGQALAQDQTAETVGAVMGGLIGLVIVIVVGAIVGWLASLIVKGSGSGFWGDVLFGIGGSLIAGYLLPLAGISLGGVVGSLIASVIGAIILILIVRFIRKAS